jgi:lysophospholipase L1-like esterase
MYYKGQPGMNINQLASFRSFNQVAQASPQLVIIDIGTNDIDNITTEVKAEGHAQIKQMVNKLFPFCQEIGVDAGSTTRCVPPGTTLGCRQVRTK